MTETLFPYARTHLRSYLERHGDSPQYLALLRTFRQEHAADAQAAEPVPPWSALGADARASVEAYAEWLMERDRKSPALKELQGYIWEEGYRNGDLVAPGVPRRARARSNAGGADGVGSASSRPGSVLAQRWLFRCSSAGDLSRHLCWLLRHAHRREAGWRPVTDASREEVGKRRRRDPVRLGRRRGARRGARRGDEHDHVAASREIPQPPEHDHARSRSFDEIRFRLIGGSCRTRLSEGFRLQAEFTLSGGTHSVPLALFGRPARGEEQHGHPRVAEDERPCGCRLSVVSANVHW